MAANKHNPERGVVVVEAVFTLLLLFIFLLGLMEVGRFISVQQVLTNAAREGARYRVAPLSGTTNLLASAAEVKEQAVCPYLTAASVKCDQVRVCVNDLDADGGDMTCPVDSTMCPPNGELSCSRVRLELPYQLITLSMFTQFSVTLQAEALMRNETENKP
jgi:Flp pilus assembly protein TadG